MVESKRGFRLSASVQQIRRRHRVLLENSVATTGSIMVAGLISTHKDMTEKTFLITEQRNNLKTTQAVWDLGDEGTSMSFRVRAYKTVNGKKVFGFVFGAGYH